MRRGFARKDEVREATFKTIARQLDRGLAAMLAAVPRPYDSGTKCNAEGYKIRWNSEKIHIDTTDCGVVVNALLTGASVHESQPMIPLAVNTAGPVTNCYDLMDATYCCGEI